MELTKLLNKIQLWCNTMEDEMVKKYPTCIPNHHKYTFNLGQKYIKIVRCDHTGQQQSVHSFVDYDGNVYKAASWAKPAEGIRATIDTVDMKDVYGSKLYR